jgi:hypothetical protein
MRKTIGRIALTLLAASLAVGILPAHADPVAVPAPVGDTPCPDVRPGAHVVTSQDTGGTLNFLFRGSDGHRYVGTAGHLLADEDTHVWKKDGPTAQIDDGTVIGRAAFAWNYNEEAADFALIRLARGVKADPAMCHWGGPTGVNTDLATGPIVLRHYGQGTGISDVVPARTMIAPTLANEVQIGAMGIAIPGDSGSPVISEDGRALGVQVHTGVIWGSELPNTEGLTPGDVGIYRLGPQLEAAEEALGIELKLLTAPLEDA